MAVQMIYLQRMPTCLNTQKRKLEKTRKYSNNYLKFGFTYKETDGDELPDGRVEGGIYNLLEDGRISHCQSDECEDERNHEKCYPNVI